MMFWGGFVAGLFGACVLIVLVVLLMLYWSEDKTPSHYDAATHLQSTDPISHTGRTD